MFLALSACVFSISPMQSVNGLQFLNAALLLSLFAAASAAAVFGLL